MATLAERIEAARAKRKAREEADTAKDKNANIGDMLAKGAVGAGLGYLSGGILPALLPGGATVAAAGPVTAAGAGATANIGIPAAIGANLMNPSSSTILSAIQGGTKAMEAKDMGGATIEGLKAGTEPTVMQGLGLLPDAAKEGKISYERPNVSKETTNAEELALKARSQMWREQYQQRYLDIMEGKAKTIASKTGGEYKPAAAPNAQTKEFQGAIPAYASFVEFKKELNETRQALIDQGVDVAFLQNEAIRYFQWEKKANPSMGMAIMAPSLLGPGD